VKARDMVSFEVLICSVSLEPITAAGNSITRTFTQHIHATGS